MYVEFWEMDTVLDDTCSSMTKLQNENNHARIYRSWKESVPRLYTQTSEIWIIYKKEKATELASHKAGGKLYNV